MTPGPSPEGTAVTPPSDDQDADDKDADDRDWAVFLGLPDAVLCADRHGKVVFSNPAADRLFSYPDGALRGRSLAGLFPPNGLHNALGKAAERTGIRRDGSALYLELSVSNHTLHGQSFLVAVIRDASARGRADPPPLHTDHAVRLLLGRGIDYAIFRLGPDGIVSHWTAGAHMLTGYRAEEAIGRHCQFLFTPEDQAAGVPGDMLRTVARDAKYESEGWRVRRDGSRFWAEVAVDVIHDIDGRTIGLSHIMHDVTQRRRVQLALVNSERRLKAFAAMAAEWFWEQDADLRFVDDPSLPSTFLPVDVGKTRWEMGDPAMDPRRWDAHKADLLARRPFRDFLWERRRPDGTKQHISVSGDPVFDDDGRFIGYHGIGRDVTAAVKAAEDLRIAKEAAEAANRAKSEFLTNIGHELRTPLHVVLGFAELIRDEGSGRTRRQSARWAEEILSSGGHLLRLLTGLIELSRLEAGGYMLTERRVALPLIARACASMARPLAQARDVRIDIAAERMTGALFGDRNAITRIMLNLVTNAVKFTPAGGRVSIYPEARPDGGLALVVADTGIGIDLAAVPALGTPFTQAEGSYSREYDGAGMGLAITERLAALHGGSLAIDSAPGRGTTVRVIFPAARVIATDPVPC